MSSHSLADSNMIPREPPYSVVLGAKGNFLAINLYENIVKIIPLEWTPAGIQATQPFNVRVRCPEAISLMPLCLEEIVHDGPVMIFYRQQTHGLRQQGAPQLSFRVKKFNMSLVDKEFKTSDINSTEDTIELEKLSTYLIHPLEFGGFLAIDPDNITVYKKKLRQKLVSKQLRKTL